MNDFSPQTGNPADFDDLAGVVEFVLDKWLQSIDDCLPAQVMSYNRDTNRAQIQIMVPMVTGSVKRVNRGQVAAVPVYQLGGGGFIVSFPQIKGDIGLLKANDRDVSLFWKSLKISQPNTQRKHKFSDGMFFPVGALNGFALDPEDNDNAVFQSTNGDVKIALWPSLIKILAPEGVGIGGTPNPSAILDLQSRFQAFIPPRMTTAEKLAISSPVEGMVVWDLDLHGLSSFNGSIWS